jgi:hypothetical protein
LGYFAITLDWPDSHTDSAGVSISLKMSRLIYNLLIIASGTLIRGGAVSVRIDQDGQGHKHISVDAKGPGLKWEPEMDAIFSGKFNTDDLSPKNVQVYLTKCYCDDLKSTLKHSIADDELVMQVVQG